MATLAMHELAGLVEERREARKASMAPQPQQQGGGVMEMAVTTESKAWTTCVTIAHPMQSWPHVVVKS